MVTLQSSGITFNLAPDLQVVYASAQEFAARFRHRLIEASDFLVALYYTDAGEVTQLLRLAARDQALFDEAALRCPSSGEADAPAGLSESARRAFADAADGAIFFCGPSAPKEAVIAAADLAVALLNQASVRALLKKAGLGDFELRHLESAIQLQQKMPPLAVPHSATPQAGIRLQ